MCTYLYLHVGFDGQAEGVDRHSRDGEAVKQRGEDTKAGSRTKQREGSFRFEYMTNADILL